MIKLNKINNERIVCLMSNDELENRHVTINELAEDSELMHDFIQDILGYVIQNSDFPISEENFVAVDFQVISAFLLAMIITRMSDNEYEEECMQEEPLYGLDEYVENITRDGACLFAPIMDENLMREKIMMYRMFAFDRLDDIIQFFKVIKNVHHGKSSLYKDKKADRYLVMLESTSDKIQEFAKVLNIAMEYGDSIVVPLERTKYFEETGAVIIKDNAMEKLSAC